VRGGAAGADPPGFRRGAQGCAIAVGAASGAGGVETEGFSNVVAGINEQGYMNYMTSIWNGENKAQGLIYQGKIARAEGQQKKQAGFLQAATTVLNSATSIAGGGYR